MNNVMNKTILNKILIIIIIGLVAVPVYSVDHESKRTIRQPLQKSQLEGPVVDDNWKWHKIGTLWNRVTNFSYMGDDAYDSRTPSCDYPGGSGNSYLYRGTIQLSAFVDGVYHASRGSAHEFAPLDSVSFVPESEERGDQETVTRYYDVYAPLATAHTPLGLEVTERTMAWGASYADDFIIYEYTIKNVGIDSNGDYYPDTDQTLTDFYFTLRLDADVSKLTSWDAEYRFSNQDDIVMCNGHIPDGGTGWEWLELFPTETNMSGIDHGLTAADIDSTLLFMFDGDNPDYPADNDEENDFGNPGVDGTLQTPGFIGFKILKTEPYMPPRAFHQNTIFNDPDTDQEVWERFLGIPEFEPIVTNPTTGDPFPVDYRGILSFGPVETLAPGDEVVVTAALSVGSDDERGGVYSLLALLENMEMAQYFVDNDYSISTDATAPASPVTGVSEVYEDNQTTGVALTWDDASTEHQYFKGYHTWKGQKNTIGNIEWEPFGAGTYDVAGTWPPPTNAGGQYELIDNDVTNGYVYYYSVQAFTDEITSPIPLGSVTTNILDENSFKVISPANPVAADNLDDVKVVPNPYIGSAAWNNALPGDSSPWEHRVQFTNLPEDAVIKIFTLDGDFVKELKTNSSVVIDPEYDVSKTSVAEWDLLTKNNQEAAPGLYLYVIDSESLGQKTGKFVIIR